MFALVDCNNFYASCERLFNPALRQRPVVVLSNNDGCVIARSEEAKAVGIQMGTPAFKCRDLFSLHNIAVFSSNYPLYGDMSSRVMTTLADLVPDIEIYSIDEAFLDLTGCQRYDIIEYGRHIRSTVLQHTGIPVSVGIAPTKTLAKIASRLAKKSPRYRGVCLLETDKDILRVLEHTRVEDIWGIGRQSSRLLYKNNIKSAADLAATPVAWVQKNMHITGSRIQAELNGKSCLPIELVRPAKQSICTSRSFGRNVTSLEELQQAVATFAGKCALKLRKEGSMASLLTVFINTSPFTIPIKHYLGTRTVSLNCPTQDTFALLRTAQALLDSIFLAGYAYKKAGVIVSGIVPSDSAGTTLPLFPDEQPAMENRNKKLMLIMDSINQRYGQGSIRMASENSSGWQSNQGNLSPRYTTRWSDIISVRK